MKYMTDTLGLPSKMTLSQGCRCPVFFNDNGSLKSEVKSITTTMDMFSKPLKERIEDKDFLSFIETFLQWDPKKRISAIDALNHPWVSKGLP